MLYVPDTVPTTVRFTADPVAKTWNAPDCAIVTPPIVSDEAAAIVAVPEMQTVPFIGIMLDPEKAVVPLTFVYAESDPVHSIVDDGSKIITRLSEQRPIKVACDILTSVPRRLLKPWVTDLKIDTI